jgi:hypothetical protein
MNLHLLLLASVFNLSSGFMAELKGTLAEAEGSCTGAEYADFKHCVTLGATADPSIDAEFIDFEDLAVVKSGGDDRRLQSNHCRARGCNGTQPRGTFCYTMCGGSGRRLEQEGTDKPNFLRRVAEEDSAVFAGGEYTGTNDEAIAIAKDIIECFGELSTNHPCLGDTVDMTLTVIL